MQVHDGGTTTGEEAQAPTEKARAIAAELRLNDPVYREQSELETLALLRAHLPAAWLPNELGSPFLLTRYADIKQILQRPEQFSADVTGTGREEKYTRSIPLNIDPPEQREYRKILEPVFSPQAMSELEPDIESFAGRLIDRMLELREFDFMEEFAVPFPTIIFCRLMGFPLEDHGRLMRWQELILHGRTPAIADEAGIAEREPSGRPEEAAFMQLRGDTQLQVVRYIEALLEQRRREPRHDLVSRLLAARYEGSRPLTHDELVNICYLFFLAGLDTVTGTLGLIMHRFAERPEDRDRFMAVLDDPQALTAAVEELVRYTSISPASPRRARQDCEVAGARVGEGQLVTCMLFSADRDESVFDRPNELVYDRHPNPHLAFSVGVHRCLGIHLARRELRIALKAIHERMPAYQLQHGKPVVRFTDGNRGLHTLPLALQSGAT